MKQPFIPLVSAFSILVGSVAFAGPMATGRVGSFDREAGTFWVVGEQYVLPDGTSRRGLSNGDKVLVSYENQDGARVVRSFTIEESGSDD